MPRRAVLLGALALNERLGPRHALGLAPIGIGLAPIDGRPVTLLRGRPRQRLAGGGRG